MDIIYLPYHLLIFCDDVCCFFYVFYASYYVSCVFRQ